MTGSIKFALGIIYCIIMVAHCDYKTQYSDCCKEKTHAECIPMCKYDVKFQAVQDSFLAGTCPPTDHLENIIKCASQGKDATDCCKKIDGMPEHCISFCSPDFKAPDKIGPKQIQCAFKLEAVMKCFEDTVKDAPEPPSESKPSESQVSNKPQGKPQETSKPKPSKPSTGSKPNKPSKPIPPEKASGAFMKCCQKHISSGCQSLCRYDVKPEEIRAAVSSKQCPPTQFFQGVFRCAALGRSSKQCCRKAGLDKKCRKYCSENPKVQKLTKFDAVCSADAETIFTCHYNKVVGKAEAKKVPTASNSQAANKPSENSSGSNSNDKPGSTSSSQTKPSSTPQSKPNPPPKPSPSSQPKPSPAPTPSSRPKPSPAPTPSSRPKPSKPVPKPKPEPTTGSAKPATIAAQPLSNPDEHFMQCCKDNTHQDCLKLCKYDVTFEEAEPPAKAGGGIGKQILLQFAKMLMGKFLDKDLTGGGKLLTQSSGSGGIKDLLGKPEGSSGSGGVIGQILSGGLGKLIDKPKPSSTNGKPSRPRPDSLSWGVGGVDDTGNFIELVDSDENLILDPEDDAEYFDNDYIEELLPTTEGYFAYETTDVTDEHVDESDYEYDEDREHAINAAVKEWQLKYGYATEAPNDPTVELGFDSEDSTGSPDIDGSQDSVTDGWNAGGDWGNSVKHVTDIDWSVEEATDAVPHEEVTDVLPHEEVTDAPHEEVTDAVPHEEVTEAVPHGEEATTIAESDYNNGGDHNYNYENNDHNYNYEDNGDNYDNGASDYSSDDDDSYADEYGNDYGGHDYGPYQDDGARASREYQYQYA